MSESSKNVASEIVYNKIDFSWRPEKISAVLLKEISDALTRYASEQVQATWAEAAKLLEPPPNIGYWIVGEELLTNLRQEFIRRSHCDNTRFINSINRLTQERDTLRLANTNANGHIGELSDELAVAVKERDILKAALRKYGRHIGFGEHACASECPISMPEYKGLCTCGFTDVLGGTDV